MKHNEIKTNQDQKVDQAVTKVQKDDAIPVRIWSDSWPVITGVEKVTEYIEFAMWMATPSYDRKPKNQRLFAGAFRVNEDTLTAWKSQQQFWQVVLHFIRSKAKERAADVVEGLYMKASSEKTTNKDTLMFLDIAGMEINQTKNKKKG
jgi:hypothetical protein